MPLNHVTFCNYNLNRSADCGPILVACKQSKGYPFVSQCLPHFSPRVVQLAILVWHNVRYCSQLPTLKRDITYIILGRHSCERPRSMLVFHGRVCPWNSPFQLLWFYLMGKSTLSTKDMALLLRPICTVNHGESAHQSALNSRPASHTSLCYSCKANHVTQPPGSPFLFLMSSWQPTASIAAKCWHVSTRILVAKLDSRATDNPSSSTFVENIRS